MLVSRLLVLSVVANANLKEADRLATDKYAECNHQTLPPPHPKTNMEKLPEVHHSEGIHLDVFPKLPFFHGVTFLSQRPT